MSDTIIEEALRLLKTTEAATTLTEHQREQLPILANYQRLRAERLAREAEPRSSVTSPV